MSSFNDITTLSLGNTFGAWYNKTNEIINQVNLLDVASITGGDGILILDRPSPFTGGYTVEFSGNVTKNTTFAGDVSIVGTLTYGALNSQMTSTELNLPYESGITIGNIVYMKPDGYLGKAQANDECSAEVVGIVKGISGDQATVATTGRISGASMAELITGITGATFIPGTVYFLSEGISGIGTTLEPNVTDYVSKPVVLGLTGDTALILPYRGFIAYYGTGGNSTTVVSGVCGAVAGVLSVNGISAAIWSGSVSPNNRRIDGHIHAVSSLNVGSGASTSTPTVGNTSLYIGRSLSGTSQREHSRAIDPYLVSGKVQTKTHTSNSLSIVTSSVLFDDNSANGYLFSTSGISGDFYRLDEIKITDLSVGGFSFPTFNLNWVLKRSVNPHSGTLNYVRNVGSPGEIFAGPYGTENVLEYRMKNYVIFGKDNGSGNQPDTFLYGTEVTTPSELFYPVIRSGPPVQFDPVWGFDAGVTASTISGTQDSSGVYPIIYSQGVQTSYTRSIARNFVWKFNNHILDSAEIHRWLENSLESRWQGWPQSLGLTMESAIIGWIAGVTHENGAISEDLFIGFPSFESYPDIMTYDVPPLIVNVDLTVSKYNPTTKTTYGEPRIISRLIRKSFYQLTLNGRPGTSIGSV